MKTIRKPPTSDHHAGAGIEKRLAKRMPAANVSEIQNNGIQEVREFNLAGGFGRDGSVPIDVIIVQVAGANSGAENERRGDGPYRGLPDIGR